MMKQALSTWVPVIRGLMLLALLHNYQKWISNGFRNAGLCQIWQTLQHLFTTAHNCEVKFECTQRPVLVIMCSYPEKIHQDYLKWVEFNMYLINCLLRLNGAVYSINGACLYRGGGPG